MHYNLDKAYKTIGEYGRSQWLLTFVNCVARNAGTYMYYPFAYLVLEQKFLCYDDGLSTGRECSSTEICASRDANPLYNAYEVDTSYQYYIKNWFLEMDLVCMTPARIGIMISAYYIGFAIGGLFCAWPDKYGRKFSCMFGLLLASISQTVMIASPNFWVRFAMFFLSGLSQIKNSVSYVWLSECTSQPYKAQSFTWINIFDALPMVLTCGYFMLVSKNWMHLPLLFTILSYIALFLAYFCPESPRWLLVNGQSSEAITALNQMSRMNKSAGTIPTNALFVEDPTNIQLLAEGAASTAHKKSSVGAESPLRAGSKEQAMHEPLLAIKSPEKSV